MEIEVATQAAKWRLVAPAADETGELDRRAWYLEQLTTFFNEEELRTLCYELGVDYEDLPASGAHGKARELMGYLERRKRMDRLERVMRRERPFLFEG